MAYAALVTVARVIDQILPHHQAYSFICEKEQLKSLREKVIRFQEFLEYISTKSWSPNVDELESRIRMRTKWRTWSSARSFGQEEGDTTVPPVAGTIQTTAAVFASCIEQVDILLEKAGELTRVRHEKLVKTGITGSHAATSSSAGPPGCATDTIVELIEDDLVKILDRLTGRPRTLQVVPITGMGGIGKTTLAGAVFEDSRIVHDFDVRLWVTVSQEYDVQEILRGLLPGEKKQDEPVRKLIELVYKHLYGRRYLIVLDDMWHEEVWDQVQLALPKREQGSRVILTTRLVPVAAYAGCSVDVHKMPFLNEEQSWDLLRGRVCGLEQCPRELEDIGKTISRNCKGLPLTVVVIAGLLKFNKTLDYWEEVVESTKAKADDSLLGILSLSYTNLPARLKACFLYLGSYPEDFKIPTKELVKLWCAEGFLEPGERETIEEVAGGCLEELVERNLLLVKEKYNGKIKTSSIHDVWRELSLKEAQEENFLLYFRKNFLRRDAWRKIIIHQRRVSFSQLSNLQSTFDGCDVPVRSLRNECVMNSDEVVKFYGL